MALPEEGANCLLSSCTPVIPSTFLALQWPPKAFLGKRMFWTPYSRHPQKYLIFLKSNPTSFSHLFHFISYIWKCNTCCWHTHFTTVTTLLGKGAIQGRNKLWSKNLERKWQTGNGKQGLGLVIILHIKFGPNRRLVWTYELNNKGEEQVNNLRKDEGWNPSKWVPSVSCLISPYLCPLLELHLSPCSSLCIASCREFLVIPTG